MKFLILFCVIAHFTSATPPFFGTGGLFSSGLLGSLGSLAGAGSNTETDVDDNGASLGSSSHSSSSGGFAGRQIAGDVLGVKIGLLTALRNIVSPQEQEVGFENTGPAVETGHVDGTGAGVSGFGGGSQMFSAGSGFSQFGSGASESSGASAHGSYAGQGYNSGAANSGYASNGGYSYNRPQTAPVGNALSSNNGFVPSQRFDSDGFSGGSFETQHFNGGSSGSEFSSGSASLDSNDFGSSSGTSASRSGTAGLGGSSGVGSLVQVPIQLLTAYRNGINRGFDSVSSGVSLLQRILGGLGGGDSNRRYK